ncbi:MAG: hypothetical protein ACI83D_000752 [Planctomycetota bacterium]|jgi:hypothetical protein
MNHLPLKGEAPKAYPLEADQIRVIIQERPTGRTFLACPFILTLKDGVFWTIPIKVSGSTNKRF